MACGTHGRDVGIQFQIKGPSYPEKKNKNLELGLISSIFEITEYTPRKKLSELI